jgi:two-component system sensor kinase FixL
MNINACDLTDHIVSDEIFRLTVESCPCGMIMTDRGGKIMLVNAEVERLFGYRREELVGEPIDILVPPAARTAHRGHQAAFAEHPQARRVGVGRDLYGMRKDGTRIPVEIGLTPIHTDRGLLILSSITNITERKLAQARLLQLQRRTLERDHAQQKQEEAETVARRMTVAYRRIESGNQELEDFAYAAAHDLKAPLRVIDNTSKWLEEDLQEHLTGEMRENMTLLRGRVGRMERLLDDLLEYSRIGQATDSDHAEIVAGDVLMDDILALLSPPEGFTVKVGAGFADIRVRSMPLQQILLNLVGNAIKHHDRCNGRIEATAEDCGTHFVFAVKDDGPGIPARFHDQIFKIFRTLKPRDRLEGSGMGLAMVRKNIEVYGGTLELESAEGQGSTFRFTWPKLQQARGDLA